MGFHPRAGSWGKTRHLFAPALLILALVIAAPAMGQDAKVDVSLSAAELLALQATWDRWPISEPAPPGYWDLQVLIWRAVDANPEVQRALEALLAAKRCAVAP
jgi:hypothetical protein